MASGKVNVAKNVLVTGSSGFVGKNLVTALIRRGDVRITTFEVDDDITSLNMAIDKADVIFHLAGVNRPQCESEFFTVNLELTSYILARLEKNIRQPLFVLSSSIQADSNNPYGRSKLAAEGAALRYNNKIGAPVCIYRFPNLFGKWSRPNYNSVVATFCYNIARGLDISLSDPSNELELAYIDDVVEVLIKHIDEEPKTDQLFCRVEPTYKITLGELVSRINQLHDIRNTLEVPDLSNKLTRALHATYLSFLPIEQFACSVNSYTDDRGSLFELIKSKYFGQVFVSKTSPGITRGNHYHDTKVEKFCVVRGSGVIRFRLLGTDEVLEYKVNDRNVQVVDIPPGYTHSIENCGQEEMICLFWANQIYDQQRPDTFVSEVLECKK